MKEDAIIWQGAAVFVTFTKGMAPVLGPYAVCVSGTTHAVIVGRTATEEKAMRCARRLDRYPAKARAFAGLEG
jgi:hypothetical protein